MLVTTTTSEHIGHWIKMRRSLARFSALESSVRARYSADFIITTPGLRFSVHTTGREDHRRHHYRRDRAHARVRRFVRWLPQVDPVRVWSSLLLPALHIFSLLL